MTKQTVKLSQLRLAPENVRKVKPAAIDQLAADIQAHGLLQNLVGYEDGKHVYVCAGGRRYRALKKLQAAKIVTGSYEVTVDIRDKAEAVELSLAENVQREAMHVADAVRAYGELARDDGLSPEDIAARFGVALSYVRKVLRLSALHPDALVALAANRIGMEAAQALTLTDDRDRQLEALKLCGNNAHAIRRVLTAEKLASDHKLFRFVGAEAYAEAGGSITRDLFVPEGDGYADDPALVERLASEKLDTIAEAYRAQGWSEVRASADRPDDYYSLTVIHPSGHRDETGTETAERAAIAAAQDARRAEIGDNDVWRDPLLTDLAARTRALDESLALFDAEQMAEGAMLVFVGPDGSVEAKPVRTKRAKAKVDGERAASPDYSGSVIEALTRIKTLAVQEAVATDPGLALDIMLDCLAGQIAHDEGSYMSPLALCIDTVNAKVPDDLLTATSIVPVASIGAETLAALPERERFAFIRAMDPQAKSALLAILVAGSIDGGLASGMRRGTRHSRFETIANAAGLDMATRWQPTPAFFARLKKPVILAILTEALGQAASDNCAKMKKGELAIAAADRLAGSGWLPPALRRIEPPAEMPRSRWQPDDDDDFDGDDGDGGDDGVDADYPDADGVDDDPDDDFADAPEDESELAEA